MTGYLMTAETVNALEGLDLAELPLPVDRRRRALLLWDGRSNQLKSLRGALEQAGAEVTVVESFDYQQMTKHPQVSERPWRRSVQHWRGSMPGRRLAPCPWLQARRHIRPGPSKTRSSS